MEKGVGIFYNDDVIHIFLVATDVCSPFQIPFKPNFKKFFTPFEGSTIFWVGWGNLKNCLSLPKQVEHNPLVSKSSFSSYVCLIPMR